MTYLIGQSLGIFSTAGAIARPFCKEKRQILLLNIFVNSLVSLNYVLIGQFGSATALCLVAVVQSLISMVHDARKTPVGTGEIILFTGLYLGLGILGVISAPGFVWEISVKNLLELLPISGAMLLMAALFAPHPQSTRKFLLINGIVWTIYALSKGSSTFLTNAVSATAAAVALYRSRRQHCS